MSLNPPIHDWRGQRVWLIGASTGIGRALASQLHALGATVIVSARKMEALQAFADQHRMDRAQNHVRAGPRCEIGLGF